MIVFLKSSEKRRKNENKIETNEQITPKRKKKNKKVIVEVATVFNKTSNCENAALISKNQKCY